MQSVFRVLVFRVPSLGVSVPVIDYAIEVIAKLAFRNIRSSHLEVFLKKGILKNHEVQLKTSVLESKKVSDLHNSSLKRDSGIDDFL